MNIENRGNLLRRVLPALAVGTMAFAGCASDGEPTIDTAPIEVVTPGSEVDQPANAGEAVAREEVCPEAFTMETPIAEEFSLSVVGGENSILPNFNATTAVDSELIPASEAASMIMDRSCIARDVLASFDAVFLQPGGFNEQGTIKLPDEDLLNVLQARSELFKDNPEEALRTLANLQSVILEEGGLIEVDDFNVIANQAVILAPLRNENTGNAEQLIMLPITTDGTFDGYRVVFPIDNPEYTQTDIDTLRQISDMVLIRPNGELIIKSWIGNAGSSTDFEVVEDAPTTEPVTTEITEDGVVVTVTTVLDANGQPQTVRTIPGPDGTPVVVTIAPDGTPTPVSPAPDQGPETPATGTTATGNGGSGGNENGDCGSSCGTGGGGTPTPTPAPTTPWAPPSVPTTPLPTAPPTTPATTTTTTSPPPPPPPPPTVKKPPINCDPVIDMCN